MFLKRLAIAGLIVGIGLAAFSLQTTAQQNSTTVTFNKDVLPILQKNCQTCHRPGEIAPMSFLTYKDTRPWAKAIKAAVVSRQMPPWFADPAYGHFANDRTAERCRNQHVCRVGGRRRSGRRREGRAGTGRVFHDGWSMQPDMIIEMPKDVPLPATGTINYKSILVKANFTEDRWVVAAEMRPGNTAGRSSHARDCAAPGSAWMKDAVPGVAYEAGDPEIGRQDAESDLLGKFNPGLGEQDFSHVRVREVRAERLGHRL